MVVDLSNNLIQYILSILNVIFIYITKIGLLVGLMMTTEKISKAMFYKERRGTLNAIGKGMGITAVFLGLYILFL